MPRDLPRPAVLRSDCYVNGVLTRGRVCTHCDAWAPDHLTLPHAATCRGKASS